MERAAATAQTQAETVPTCTPAERARAQATNEPVIFAVGLASSLVAGALLQRLGWQTLNAALLPCLALAAAAIPGLGLVRRRQLVGAPVRVSARPAQPWWRQS